MGYASRNNPTAQAAKSGELAPKKPKMSKKEQDAWLHKQIQDRTGLPQLVRALGGEHFYV